MTATRIAARPFAAGFAALLATTLLITGAQAQDLEAEVVQNPDNTVTYAIDIDGPPGGAAFVFGSPLLLPQPIQIPGVLFPCHIDPLAVLNLGIVPLDPQGKQQLNFNLPAAQLQGIDIKAQCVCVDAANVLAFTPFVAGAQGVMPFFGMGFAWDYAAGAKRFRTTIKGNPGDQIRVTINGGQGGTGYVIIGANGKGTVQIDNVDLKKGDAISYERNGTVVQSDTVD